MPHATPRIRTVLCLADLPGEHTLSLAQFVDGRFGIYLDSAIETAEMWNADRLQRCINVYLARKWALQHPNEADETTATIPGVFSTSIVLLCMSAVTSMLDAFCDCAVFSLAT